MMLRALNKLSARERRLLQVTVILVVAIIGYLVLLPAYNYLGELDEQAADLEFQLVQMTEHAARSVAVDQTYSAIAAEHGSTMTRQAIHDSLRAELLRLALRDMPEYGDDIPVTAEAARIVVFRDLPEGTLNAGLEGYREYAIEVKTLSGNFPDLVLFLQRIYESPLPFRIKRLEITRQPDQNAQAAAVIELARVVVDGVTDSGEPARIARVTTNSLGDGTFEYIDAEKGAYPGWVAIGAEVSPAPDQATEGANAAKLVARNEGASVYQEVSVEGGQTYVVQLDISGDGKIGLGAADAQGASTGPIAEVTATQSTQRYPFLFTAPGASGERVDVRLPVISMTTKDSTVYIDNVSIIPVGDGVE